MEKGWGEDQFLLETIQSEKSVQKEIFQEAIRRLEDAGKCHSNFHLLALHWFGDTLGEW